MLTVLAELDEKIFRRAAAIIATGEQHCPVILVFRTDGAMEGIDCSSVMSTERGKDAVSQVISSRMAEADLIAFISEAWGIAVQNNTKAADLWNAGVTPSAHPARYECVNVAYSLKDGRRAMTTHRIHRTEGAAPRLERGPLEIPADARDLKGRFFAEVA